MGYSKILLRIAKDCSLNPLMPISVQSRLNSRGRSKFLKSTGAFHEKRLVIEFMCRIFRVIESKLRK